MSFVHQVACCQRSANKFEPATVFLNLENTVQDKKKERVTSLLVLLSSS
jgi:hypothetical protein